MARKVNCAWCNEEQGKPQGENSHGACKKHIRRLELEYEAIKANRAKEKEKVRA